MKKIALCSLVVGLSMVSNAYSGCNPNNTVSYVGNQKPEDDEFLYMNESEYKKSKSGWENSKHYNSGDGHAFECDSNGLFTGSSGCDNRHVEKMPAGHVFKGEVINEEREYQCYTVAGGAGDDQWMPLTSTSNICSTKWGNLKVGESYKGKTTIDCSGLAKTEDNVGLVKTWDVVCRQGPNLVCKPYECITGYTVDVINGKCVPDAQQCTFSDGSKHNLGESVEYDCSQSPDTPEFRQNSRTGVRCYQTCLKRNAGGALTNYWSVKTCSKDKDYVAFDSSDYQKYTPNIPGYKRCDNANVLPEIVVTPENKSCKNSRSTVNGKACCDIPSNEAKYDAKTDKCNCLNGKEFEIDANGRGQCVVKEQRQQAEEQDCYDEFFGAILCPNGNSYTALHRYKIAKSEMLSGENCETAKARFKANTDLMDKKKKEICAEKQSAIVVTVPVGPSETQIKDARDTLKTFAANAEAGKSGWKTAEGNFNTTRLASDLTAGVVLGTVGGVVSGVVIKKKQVEKGFDALHCTVGGQKIADWGDTFTVGLQR